MSLSSFVIRIIFLSLPGIIASLLYRKLKGRPVQKDWEDVLEIAVFSLLSYCAYGLLVWVLTKLGGSSSISVSFQAFYDEKVDLPGREIFLSTVIGVPLSFVAAAVYKHKLITKLGKLLRVTNRYGDDDVWQFFQNLSGTPWVFVRDHKLDLIYTGWIAAYSDSEKERELLMSDVDVYTNSEGRFLYSTPSVYLSRNRYDLTIEVPTEFGARATGQSETE